MSLQILIRKKGLKGDRFENLDKNDLIYKINPVLKNAITQYFKPSAVITVVQRITESDVQDISDLAWDTFKILYCELEWNLSRCLDEFPRIFKRRTQDRNWDILADEGKGMWVPATPEEKWTTDPSLFNSIKG